jgi:hypothetical protein
LKPIAYPPNKESPVFVIGDFKEPSHLDWTEAAAKADRQSKRVEYPYCSDRFAGVAQLDLNN